MVLIEELSCVNLNQQIVKNHEKGGFEAALGPRPGTGHVEEVPPAFICAGVGHSGPLPV